MSGRWRGVGPLTVLLTQSWAYATLHCRSGNVVVHSARVRLLSGPSSGLSIFRLL